ncbi:MAG: tetratricopeptide repeat protein [Candidatus Kapaibacterium sp.]
MMQNKKILYLIVALVAFFVYYNSLNNDFVFDDESVVQNNQSITVLSNIPKFFTAEEGFHKVIGRYYRPVVSTLYTIDYAIWGLNPFGFHLTNVIIHAIASLLLLMILLKLFGEYKLGILSALIGALIFAVHPIHTEAVSWVSGRTDSLTTMFFFLSFLFYIKYSDENNSKSLLIISLIAYFLGLLSKEMIVTMPVLLFVYDYFFRKRRMDWFKQNILPYALFIVVTIVFVFIRYLVLKDVVDRETYMYFYGEETSTAFYTMLKTIPVYFRLLVFPLNLLYHYNGIMPDSHTIGDVKVILSGLFIVAMFIISFYIQKKYGEVSFTILFFLVSLLPVMNIVPTMNFMAERFLYLSSFALSVLISLVIVRFFNEKNKGFLTTLFLVIVVVFTYLTFIRNAEWKNNDTLFITAEGKEGSVLLVNVGNIYANKKNYAEAEKRYRRAIEIRDNSVLAHHNLGLIYLLRGDIDSAEIKFKKGMSIDSLAPDGYFQMSNIYQQKGNIPDAVKMLEKLQTIVPNYRESKAMLDMLKSNPETLSGNIPNSVQNNQMAILEKRSFQYYQEGKFEEAIKDLNEAVRLSPESGSGYLNNIAMCYIGLKKFDKAKENFTKAIELDDKNFHAYSGLADVYLQEGNTAKAKEIYAKILSLNPQDMNAKNKLDSLNRK